MTKENIKTNTSLRYSQYQKRLLHTFSFEKLKKQIEMLHDQEFIITVPIGGVVDEGDRLVVLGDDAEGIALVKADVFEQRVQEALKLSRQMTNE